MANTKWANAGLKWVEMPIAAGNDNIDPIDLFADYLKEENFI
tara:strand:+ start:1352 stop:1477 length:126 start_codon:yes stop_codon:yes gene_type:complete